METLIDNAVIGRRDVLRAAASVGVASAVAVALPAAAAQKETSARHRRRRPPNILLIFMDDMAHRAIGSLNNPEVQTPNIDRIARRGTVFTHAFHGGAWSGAVCIPSRAMLITGLTCWHAKTRINDVPLLGETFGKNGYETYFTGKWHNGPETLNRSYRTVGPHAGGFLESTPVGGDAYDRPSPGNHWDPADPTRKGHWLHVADAPAAGGKTGVVHSSEHWADAAVAFLQSPAAAPGADKPFFLHVAFHGPHDPRQAPQEYLDKYPADKMAIPPNFLPEHPFDQGEHRTRDELLAPFPRTHEAVQLHRREYYAILTHADHQIGRILDALDASGQADNTIVVFSGDHGLAVGEHGLLGKQNQYDHSVRVPLIFAGPDIPGGGGGRKIDALISQNGIYPTLCALTGVPIPSTVENKNLAPLIQGKETTGFDALYGALTDVQRMVRTDRHKLIVYPKVKRVQLFDVQEDPWERHDLSGDAANKPLIRQLWARMNELQRERDDPMMVAPFGEWG